jgi:hypothetical protein
MMIRVRIRIALSGLLVLGVFPVACHRTAPVRKNADVGPVIRDTAVVVAITDTSVVALFKDTAVVSVFSAEGQTFKLQTPGQRQSLHATLRKERALWQARKPRDYKFLLRVGCFCPGSRGWLLIEVRSSHPLRAWDKAGKSVALTDWNTLSIDGVYDNLERTADRDGEVQIAFDQHWHFPTYIRTNAARVPDAWSIIEARALRPI